MADKKKLTIVSIVLAIMVVILSIGILFGNLDAKRLTKGFKAGQYTVVTSVGGDSTNSNMSLIGTYNVTSVKCDNHAMTYKGKDFMIRVSDGMAFISENGNVSTYSDVLVMPAT